MILLMDTSAAVCRLTLVDGDQRFEYEWEANRELAKQLLAWLRDRLAEHDTSWHDITGIGAFAGPGSFTGLRIGLTVLNTIADSKKIPIVGSTGNAWQTDAIARLESGEDDKIVLPQYGSEANITTPRK